jgi:uncharacterized repeat protein (TIGR01451 family)
VRKVARIVLALQLAAVAVLLATQVAASAQSPAPAASSSAAASASPTLAASNQPASPTAAGGASPSGPAASSPASTPSAPGSSPTPPAPEPPSDTGKLEISSASTSLLVQLGRAVHYRVVVSNTGDSPLHGVYVVDLLPREVTFVSAPLPNQVEAALYGKVGAQENITWNVGTLRPGQSVTLPWSGTAASLGDMTALNAVRAEAAGAPRTRREDRTYMATSSRGRVANPAPTPTQTTVVTVRRIPSGTVLGSPDAAGETMPLTGFDPLRAVLLASFSMAVGVLAWWSGAGRTSRRRKVIVAVTALALLAACTASRDEAAPRSTVSPQVKGKRIDKNDDAAGPDEASNAGDQQPGAGDATEPADDGDSDGSGGSEPGSGVPPIASTPAPAAPVPGPVLVRTTRVVTVGPVLRPPVALDSRGGDNALTYTWDHDSASVVSASSSTAFGPPRGVRIDTSLGDSEAGTEAIATITNTSRRQPLILDGRIDYALRAASGQVASLVSGPVQMTLNPGGSTSVRFTYDLPSGTYSVTSSYEAN